ncbi:MAG: hypothetical protein GY750_07345 [Lentisphaerae bacterium]|nr:hypothetical protein [Lentisphaerota bacterium]MCP4101224.1 hypothetical protein [Lentisphaerota bacterium]
MRFYINSLKYIVISLLVAVWGFGCRSVDVPNIEPPAQMQVEDQVSSEAPDAVGELNGLDDLLPGTRPVSIAQKTAENKTIALKRPEQPPVVPFKKHLNVNKVVTTDGNGSLFLSSDNFIVRWNVFGPFYYSSNDLQLNGTKSVLHREFVKDEKSLTGTEDADTGLTWRLVRFNSKSSPGQVDLAQVYKGKNQYAAAYAVTYLYSKEALDDLILYAGSSGYIKIWVNHQLVHAYDRQPRTGKWDQDVVKNISMRKGYNLVVVKCVSVGSNWDFFLRFSDRNDNPLKFIPQN